MREPLSQFYPHRRQTLLVEQLIAQGLPVSQVMARTGLWYGQVRAVLKRMERRMGQES